MNKNLYSPFIDFLLLGGLSLIIAPICFVFLPDRANFTEWYLIALVVMHFTADPHFIYSYQLFYRNFREKIRANNLPNSLRYRYIFSGLMIPVFFLFFFTYTISFEKMVLLGYTVNIMGLTVLWHYAKQGYGIFIVDSVMKKNFFSKEQKDILLINVYVAFITAWIGANQMYSNEYFMGLSYYTFKFPPEFVFFMYMAAGGTLLLSLVKVIIPKLTEKGLKNFPFNGCMAYLATLYVWLYVSSFNPIFFLFVPAFHSLQYFAIVWRYEYNRLKDEKGTKTEEVIEDKRAAFQYKELWPIISFIILGVILGYVAFFGIPVFLETFLNPYQESTGIFLAITWVFINIHHYFMDNVIWRKENPEIKKHLFS